MPKHTILTALFSATAAVLLIRCAAADPPAPLPGGPPPAAYTSLRQKTLTDGRALAAFLVTGDVKAVYVHADPRFAQSVPQDQFTHLLDSVRAQGVIGERIGEGALVEGPETRLYIGDYRYQGGYLEIKFGFTPSNQVNFLLMTPHPALPNPKAGYQTKTRLRLPFDGQWWVFWGGDAEAENYHVLALDQRHAYDFCVWQGEGTHQGDGSKNSDYWAWGRSVAAPASATVVEAVDGIADNTPGVMNRSALAGNHVVLDFGDGEYALIAHLQHGSVSVHPGDHVSAGQTLGLCGNSGNSSEPHVHMHLQDRAELFHGAVGLPLAFEDYLADGVKTERGTPTQGQFVCAETNESDRPGLKSRAGKKP